LERERRRGRAREVGGRRATEVEAGRRHDEDTDRGSDRVMEQQEEDGSKEKV
jgi:hypothetical protein